MKDYVVVVGGLNIDIAGLSGDVYREKDSNIGEEQLTLVVSDRTSHRT